MPRCVAGNYDSLVHATVADLAFCAQHELDLYIEGEPNEIRNQKDLARAKEFYKLCTGTDYRWQ